MVAWDRRRRLCYRCHIYASSATTTETKQSACAVTDGIHGACAVTDETKESVANAVTDGIHGAHAADETKMSERDESSRVANAA